MSRPTGKGLDSTNPMLGGGVTAFRAFGARKPARTVYPFPASGECSAQVSIAVTRHGRIEAWTCDAVLDPAEWQAVYVAIQRRPRRSRHRRCPPCSAGLLTSVASWAARATTLPAPRPSGSVCSAHATSPGEYNWRLISIPNQPVKDAWNGQPRRSHAWRMDTRTVFRQYMNTPGDGCKRLSL